MCVIIVCDSRRPTEDEWDRATTQNSDGFGIAWRELDKQNPSNDRVVYVKSMNDKDIWPLVEKAPLPFVVHCRWASIGGKGLPLCHPFEITPDSQLQAEGKARAVLFHNGHWMGWKDMLLQSIVGRGARVPKGPWNDSRTLAVLTAVHGEPIVNLIDPGRVAILSPTRIRMMGSGWTGDTGIWLSSSITSAWKPGKHGCVVYSGGYAGGGNVYTSYGSEGYGRSAYTNEGGVIKRTKAERKAERAERKAEAVQALVGRTKTKAEEDAEAEEFMKKYSKELEEEYGKEDTDEENRWIQIMKGESE